MSDEERVLGWLEENYKGLLIGLLLAIFVDGFEEEAA